jgi:general stress protein YciG
MTIPLHHYGQGLFRAREVVRRRQEPRTTPSGTHSASPAFVESGTSPDSHIKPFTGAGERRVARRGAQDVGHQQSRFRLHGRRPATRDNARSPARAARPPTRRVLRTSSPLRRPVRPAARGGEAASQDREHMSVIGRKGGEEVSRDREHMADIGREGGERSHSGEDTDE